MKKILSIFTVGLMMGCTSFVFAEEVNISSRRADLVAHYLKKSPARELAVEDFLKMVQEGDVASISLIQNISLFSAKDKFGNNCFHLAKNADTLQALARVIRQLSPAKMKDIFTQLRNERNEMGETPLMAHISYGKSDTFFLLYKGSELDTQIKQVLAVDKGGALAQTAQIRKGVVLALSKDAAGRTVAQTALVNADKPGMSRVINFFKTNASYLF